jgi:hypothetical protein
MFKKLNPSTAKVAKICAKVAKVKKKGRIDLRMPPSPLKGLILSFSINPLWIPN